MENRKEQLRQMTAEIGNSILTAYFLVMMVLYPLYVKNGYQEIGKIKYYFFRNISLVTLGMMLLVAAVSFWLQRKEVPITTHYKRLSKTDWFVYGYFVSILFSYLFSDYRKEAFWGAGGWYMGFVSQIILIAIYFLFSRYFKWNKRWLYIILLASGLVFLLGILNRYSIYPLTISGRTPVFISTLGNINWFCGYWAVLCPLGIVLYWNSQNGYERMAAGIYTVIALLIGVVQGSSSAYLSLAGIFLFLFCISFRENTAMQRFWEICILSSLSCQIARICRYLPGFAINYESEPGRLLTDSNIALYAGIILIVIYLCLYYLIKQKSVQIARYKSIRTVLLILLIIVLAVYIALLAGNTCIPGGIAGLSEIPIFTFNDEWASFRGATWSIGLQAYRSMPPLHKFIGAGPDCFAEYIYDIPKLAEKTYALFGYSRLTNAHNEWITILVNQGIAGLVCFIGIFASAFLTFMKKAPKQPMLYLCAAAVLSYTLHNIVSFQQVLNVPFVFMILGIGEGLCRESQFPVDK
ncbi:MAG: O-antigen ligase family protein [Clostridium sp.]|nr:O-antigen ligase family protein [Clostridium sp.]